MIRLVKHSQSSSTQNRRAKLNKGFANRQFIKTNGAAIKDILTLSLKAWNIDLVHSFYRDMLLL